MLVLIQPNWTPFDSKSREQIRLRVKIAQSKLGQVRLALSENAVDPTSYKSVSFIFACCFKAGRRLLGALLTVYLGLGSIKAQEVPSLSTHLRSYSLPTKDSASSLLTTPYAPSSSYKVPVESNGFESLRDFSTSYDNTFIQRRLFNTSVALTVPLFSFTLPQRASSGSSVDLANQVSSWEILMS
jgi:hypothetical protein